MLSRLSVKNFRLLRDVTLDVTPGKPIVLVGPNGAGKSSVIQVLDLLGRAARDALQETLKAFGGAGAILPVANAGSDMFMNVEMDKVDSPLGHLDGEFDYSLILGRHGVERETAQSHFADGSGGAMSRDTMGFWIGDGGEKTKLPLSDTSQTKLSFELVRHHNLGWFNAVRRTLSTIQIYDGFLTTPLWVRDVREGQLSPFDSAIIQPCTRIDRRGLDLVNALHYLQSSHPDEWEEIERAFKAEFPFVQRLEFPADPAGGRIALGWRDRRHPGVRMLGHQMSEGMAAYLCLLAAIITPEPAAAIAFDEPDRHLHPSALRRVVELLEKLSERTAVFVATHSDRLLDCLSDPAGSVRVCEPTEEGVSIRALDREALDAWRAEFTMSELRRRGHIDPENASAVEP